MAFVLSSILYFCVLSTAVAGSFLPGGTVHLTTPHLDVPARIQRTWGTTAPFFPAGVYPPVPAGCTIDQVNILQRHGARFPTSAVGTAAQAAVAKLQSAQTFNDPKLNFLNDFTYDLGVNDLVPFGAAESFDAGQITFARYSKLVQRNGQVPFVRTTSSLRVVQSAGNWSAGFASASRNGVIPMVNVIIQESLNDTLANNMCPNAAASGLLQLATWQAIYAAAPQARLNANAPGANLTETDVSALIALCGFEVVANEKSSPFCDLFTQEEFDGFEYFGDLNSFYGTGYGDPLGPVQGVGYVNELLARLTNIPVQDQTQTNHTLDASPVTFPLNRTIYADFSHDSELIAIYSALGLFRPSQPLDPTKPDPKRTWVESRLVPFAGRLVTERLSCSARGMNGKFVRMVVNDALQDLSFCGAGKDGLCALNAFVESQSFARSNGAGVFEQCFS